MRKQTKALNTRLLTLSLIFSILLVSACSHENQSTTIIMANINGYTFDNDRYLQKFQTLVFDNGRVLETGDKSLEAKYPDAKFIDGGGRTLLPGITDAHGHVSSLGYTLLQIDLRGATSARQVSTSIASYAKTKPFLSWVQGRGWNQVLWPGQKFPTAQILDELLSDRPIWLERIDGHAGWANSRALTLAGINANTIAPPGGEIIRDSSGYPTGILIDNAMALVSQVIPPPTDEEMSAALAAASDHLISLGITSVHDAGVSAREHDYYRQLADRGNLDVRLYGMISSTDPELVRILSAGPSSDPLDLYSARSVKVYTDGALGSRGAALLEPYSDREGHSGLLLTSQEQLRTIFSHAIQAGFQVAIHAIGDKGNRIGLDEVEYAYTTMGGRELRHRIEHSQVVSLEDIPRFKALDVIPSMQPTHATSDMNMAEDRLGVERLKGAYAWRSFLDQGSILVSGSDFPIELANPFHGIHAAVTRQNQLNEPPGGWVPEQAITTEEAVRSFTLDAAWAGHQEMVLGGLTEGKWADFILVDQDVFRIPSNDLWKTTVVETWLAGKLVYEKRLNDDI
ncbi:MAG: amidohydrolase [Proteobacteria bacterium]|nr:amidohydrolase [Pseudomonadota bacterium]MDA1350920.1 amidohydrolase [Pseudomonadota bacterium]